MSHTSGPWTLDEEDFEVFEPSGGMIATVRHPQDSPCIDLGDEGYAEAATECEGNARLIAAAPELLEALKAVTTTLYDVNSEVGQQARRAIAKATGGAALVPETEREDGREPDCNYTPYEDSRSYRESMIDAGRGHLLR